MAAEVDICNTALAHLGDDATVAAITPPDGSVQAGHCARFYPQARDEFLEANTWRFNTVRDYLALSPIDPPIGWAFAYQTPSKMLKPIAIVAPSALPDFIAWWQGMGVNDMRVTSNLVDILNSQDYIVESSLVDGTPLIYTNVEDAILIYSISITDTTKFPPLALAAIARLLASKLAGPIIKGVKGTEVAEKQLAIYEKLDLPKAMTSDANSNHSHPYSSATPAPIAARM